MGNDFRNEILQSNMNRSTLTNTAQLLELFGDNSD